MAVALAQTKSGTGTTTVAVTGITAPAVGTLELVTFNLYRTSAPTIATPTGWTLLYSQIVTSGTTQVALVIFGRIADGTSQDTTFGTTTTTANSHRWVFEAYTGLPSTVLADFEVGATSQDITTGSTISAYAPLRPARSDTWVWSVLAQRSAASPTVTWSGGSTAQTTGSSANGLWTAMQQASARETVVQPQVTATGSANVVVQAVSLGFKTATSALAASTLMPQFPMSGGLPSGWTIGTGESGASSVNRRLQITPTAAGYKNTRVFYSPGMSSIGDIDVYVEVTLTSVAEHYVDVFRSAGGVDGQYSPVGYGCTLNGASTAMAIHAGYGTGVYGDTTTPVAPVANHTYGVRMQVSNLYTVSGKVWDLTAGQSEPAAFTSWTDTDQGNSSGLLSLATQSGQSAAPTVKYGNVLVRPLASSANGKVKARTAAGAWTAATPRIRQSDGTWRAAKAKVRQADGTWKTMNT